MHRRIRKLSFMALVILAACHLGPKFERPELVSDADIEHLLDLKKPEKPVLPFQIQDFQDTQLNKLISEAMDRAPDIRTARARVKAGRAARLAAVAGLLPAADVSGSYQKQRFHENTPLMPNEQFYQAGLSIAWDVDVFGQKSREVEAVGAQEMQLKAELENIMVTVVTEVGSAYIGLRTAQHLLQKTLDDLKIQKELVRLTRDKYKSGLSSAIDVNQAEYQVATTAATIPKLETEIETYQNTLAILTGRPAGSLQKRLKANRRNLITTPFRFPMHKLSALPAQVVRYRPDVVGMEAALQAQNARVGQAIANLFPTISLGALFGFESVHLNRLTNNAAQKRSYQATVTAPLFHFGALWQNVKIEEANMESAMATYEKTLLNATKETRDILVGLKKMEIRHKDLERAWHKMDAAAKLARDRYESGLIDYFQVLDAEERRISAQSAVITSSGALYQNILNFYKAVGGQFTFNRIQAADTQ